MRSPTLFGRIALLLLPLLWSAGVGRSQPIPQDRSVIPVETEKPIPVQLQSLIAALVENSPDIKAARYRHEAATKRPSQVGTLPEPRLSFVDFGVGRPFSSLDVSNFAYRGIGVSQEIPFPGKLSLAAEEARREAQTEGQMYRTTLLNQIAKLKLAYFEWFNASKAIEITHRTRDILERFEKIARARYTVGKGLQQDVLKAQVEISRLAQQIELLQQNVETAEAQINALLNRSVNSPLGVPVEITKSSFTMDLQSLLNALRESSPQLRAQEYLVDSRSVGINRAKRDFFPDFGFNFQWQKTAGQFPDYYMAMAEVRIPVYFWRKQRYAVEEASARQLEARQSYAAARQELMFEAKNYYLAAKTSDRVLALYEEGVIPQAALSLESTMAAYEVGNVDFLTLLSSLTTLLDFEMQYYAELTKHEQALARLEPLLGISLTQP